MSLKSIELQVAIPRSQDAGKMQEQMMRQGQQFQETLTQQQLRQQLLNRTKVQTTEDIEKKKIKDEENSDANEQEEQGTSEDAEQNQTEKSIEHPYLGTKVDFSG